MVLWMKYLRCLGPECERTRAFWRWNDSAARWVDGVLGLIRPTLMSSSTAAISPSLMSTSALNCRSWLTTVPPCSVRGKHERELPAAVSTRRERVDASRAPG
jgi:hypothetical protein